MSNRAMVSAVDPLPTDSELEAGPMRRFNVRSLLAGGLLAVGLLVVAAFVVRNETSTVPARPEHFDRIVELAAVKEEGKVKETAEKDDEKAEEDDTTDDKAEKDEKEDTVEKDAKDKKDDKEDKDEKKDETSKCSWGKENCNKTQCCNNPGMQCYEQSKWYAQCRPECAEGVDPTHWDGNAWTCKELGPRAEGEVVECAEMGVDCRSTGCCKTPMTQCFAKNDDWATCKSECMEGAPDLSDSNGDPWSCEKLGDWTPGPADWVAETCTQDGQDCTASGCCATPGMQCFKQSEFWAQCKYDCQTKDPEQPWAPDWSCETMGSRTPGNQGPPPGDMQAWVVDACAAEGEDCHVSRCCLSMDTQCYGKNKDWALCMNDCVEGVHEEDNNETWSCQALGPRITSGLAVKGSPSLYCWSLFQPTKYEGDIIQLQLEEDAGLFQCDAYSLLSTDDPITLKSKDGKKTATTLKVKMAEITTSVDGTAGNAQLFINTWDVVCKAGIWKQHAWVIKVDPDAVIIPSRVRDHMRSHVMENVYVVNCNAFPSSPNFPMMYGSVEIYSFQAIAKYAEIGWKCQSDMGMMISQWGEDYYMTHCLDHIGVGRISDFTSVGDNVCSGGSCADSSFSAFHPFKTVDDWHNCWDLAMGYITPPPNPWD